MMSGEAVASGVEVVAFAADGQLSQKRMIYMALSEPMTINELYRKFPRISTQNIAPLVAQLVQENKVWPIGRRKSAVQCGVERAQLIYSAREEDRPADNSATLAVLNAFCGVAHAVNHRVQGRIHKLAGE